MNDTDEPTAYQTGRRFQLWEYRVSHGQMLLRSVPPGEDATNVDVLFWGVSRIDLPTRFDGLKIALTPDRVLKIESNGRQYAVAAAGCKVMENRLPYDVSSLTHFTGYDEQIDRGREVIRFRPNAS